MRFRVTRSSMTGGQPLPEAFAEGTRPYGEPNWWVDVPTLEALAEIVLRAGQVIIHPPDEHEAERCGKAPFCLEVYDDYRE